MTHYLLLILCLASAVALPAWDRQKAFEYLEARQQQWAEWKPAQKAGGPCLSCHTGLSYLLARRVLGEKQPRPLESDLVKGVTSRVLATPPQTMLNDPGPEAIFNLLTLALQRRSPQDPLDEAERLALQRLWEKQLREGEAKGAWTWFMFDLHPVESEHSVFYGAMLAELALSAYPATPNDGRAALQSYLKSQLPQQPLHNRLAWIAFNAKKDKPSQTAIVTELFSKQATDGGWTTAALGPWSTHTEAPPDTGSNAYATAWAAFTARQSGVSCSHGGLKRALDWLEQKQDPATGAWQAKSMNKVFPAGSMQEKFMADAASGYATAALLSCRP